VQWNLGEDFQFEGGSLTRQRMKKCRLSEADLWQGKSAVADKSRVLGLSKGLFNKSERTSQLKPITVNSFCRSSR
jgi:hypothetical protein